MESYLLSNFGEESKHSSETARQRWGQLRWLVRNPKRRFRFVANLSNKLFEAEAMRRSNQEKFRVAVLVSQSALQFIRGLGYAVPEEEVVGTFDEESGSIVENPSNSTINGRTIDSDEESGSIVENPSNSTINGRTIDSDLPNCRQEIFGINLESVRTYFKAATTGVFLLCALIGSFTRVNNLISFFRSLSSERDEIYTGHINNLAA